MSMHLTKTRVALICGATVALAALGTQIATASSDDDATDQPITGTALHRATEAALAATGGGTVTETEDGDEDSRYEVEVTLPDGRQVDVQLDESFQVIDQQPDHED